MVVSGLLSNILTIVIAIVAASTQLSANAMIAEEAVFSGIDSSTLDTITYIIAFKDKGESPTKRCAAIARSSRGTVQYVYDQVLNGCSLTVSVEDVQGALNGLKNNPAVLAVEQDQVMQVTAMVPSWGLDRIDQCNLPLNDKATKQDASDG
jgi:hypothetical protein